MARSKARDDYLESFRTWLQDSGFERDAIFQLETWIGSIAVEWENSENVNPGSTKHTVAIVLPAEFPYRAPVVLSRDPLLLNPSWHLIPGSQQGLCLWNSENGWQPNFTAPWLLKRIETWFYYYHTDSWPKDSFVPDLHRYLKHAGVVVIGEDWLPPHDLKTGHFIFWQHHKYSDTFPCIAAIVANGLTYDEIKPESRLSDNLIFRPESYIKRQGIWFRLPQPFVPPSNLKELMNLIDANMGMEKGWAAKEFIGAFGYQVSSEFLPIVLGYPDYRSEERWLFLKARLSIPGQKRYKIAWSNLDHLPAITLESFQTAPAKKNDLFRRSAFLSKNLNSHRAIVFGIGALGGSVAVSLAKAGVGEIRLVDDDVLMPGNVMRHVVGLDYVGFNKTEAVAKRIHTHHPDCVTTCFSETWELEVLKKYAESCDMVIDTTANYNFSLHLNELCVAWEKPIIFAAAYRRAAIGRVIVHRSKNDPCLACYTHAREFWQENQYPVIPADPTETFIEDGCGSVTEEAVAIDIECIANTTARIAIATIQSQLGDRNLAILVIHPLEEGSGILAQEGLHWRNNRALQNCLICRG